MGYESPEPEPEPEPEPGPELEPELETETETETEPEPVEDEQYGELHRFLAHIGCLKHKHKFVHAEVPFESLLQYMDEDDLKEIGIDKGPRVKILKTMAAWRASHGHGEEPAADSQEVLATKLSDLMEREDRRCTCPICFLRYTDSETTRRLMPRVVACGHTFCEGCLEDQLDSHSVLVHRQRGILQDDQDTQDKTIGCPTCRVSIVVPQGDAANLTPNFALLG